MTEVSISTPHHQLKSYLATPEGEAADARNRIRVFFARHLASDAAYTDQKETNE
jgi:hypothetical protein